MEQSGPGRIVTFHSFQGGTGRSMAVANVGWILAAAGKKVLIVDWDLEAPGLHRFLEPLLDVESVMRRSGVIDMLREYEDGIVHRQGLHRRGDPATRRRRSPQDHGGLGVSRERGS